MTNTHAVATIIIIPLKRICRGGNCWFSSCHMAKRMPTHVQAFAFKPQLQHHLVRHRVQVIALQPIPFSMWWPHPGHGLTASPFRFFHMAYAWLPDWSHFFDLCGSPPQFPQNPSEHTGQVADTYIPSWSCCGACVSLATPLQFDWGHHRNKGFWQTFASFTKYLCFSQASAVAKEWSNVSWKGVLQCVRGHRNVSWLVLPSFMDMLT